VKTPAIFGVGQSRALFGARRGRNPVHRGILTAMRTACLVALLALPLHAQDEPDAAPPTDRELVHAAVLDYVEALYEAEPARIERSVDPRLAKLGFGRGEGGEYRESKMTFEQLVALAGKWNAKGWLPADAPKVIEVYDVLPRIACAKLTAHWGTDYFHVEKGEDGRWRIRHVLWQSPPAHAADESADERAAAKAAALRSVEQAVGGYANAFYQGKPELLDGAVHPELVKFGHYRQPSGEVVPAPMTFAQLKALVTQVAGSMPADGRKEIEVLDLQDQTALVKLTAEWGIDYMSAARFGDRWQVAHVLWQSHPVRAAAPSGPDKK